MLNISSKARLFCSNAIMISGSARSGTTVMGSLIHSMEKVEYVFEPPMLFTLLNLINDLKEHQWRLLYETYLYEEFFINSLAGRAINCNTVDDSSIFKVKTTHEIDARLNSHSSKSKIQQRSDGSVIAYKIPDVVYLIPILKEYYPLMRVVIMLRDAIDTINSLIAKKWFNIENDASDLIWPYKICSGVHVPYWVKNGDEKRWLEYSEIDRAAYYYIRVNENVIDIPGRIEVKYNDLINSPQKEVERIADILNLKFGKKTDELIGRIARTNIKRNMQILSGICDDLKEKVIMYSALCE